MPLWVHAPQAREILDAAQQYALLSAGNSIAMYVFSKDEAL
ncbi:MAG: hypothetical protein ACHQ9S_20230 [Candidatus Binatia bacterium]